LIDSGKIFRGFSPQLFEFLKDLKGNNNKSWFDQNRNRYKNYIVEPAKSFVSDIGPFINRMNPSIRTDPKFNVTLLRMNKDMRFAKGEPYRNYFLIHFGKFKEDSEFFVYFDPEEIQSGVFLNNSKSKKYFFRENFSLYQKKILNIFADNKLNKNYSLYDFKQEPIKLIQNFNAGKHLDKLSSTKYILLQKVRTPSQTNVFTPQFLIDILNIFSELYPVYAFAVSNEPLKEIQKFNENFGKKI
jgi:uncharacterized protein (TIGR02453 family)